MAVYEGEIEWRVEDGGQALIVDAVPADAPGGVGVTLTSWADEAPGTWFSRYDLDDIVKVHPELAKLIAGKTRLRITVEALD
jgi:hypothetical protein